MSAESIEKCSIVLLDIVGTTTSQNFLKDTLNPFVLKNVEEYLKTKWDEEEVKKAIKGLSEGDSALDQAAAVEKIKKLTEEDSEDEHLKAIQGLVCKRGYENGDIKAHVFDDVKESLEQWSKGRKVAVFSNGSIESQKLYFAHTVVGDLSSLISSYFDLSVGKKTEPGTYEKIVKKLDVAGNEVVFITDLIEEAKAAKSAGLKAILVSREGNKPLSDEAKKEFTVIKSFVELISSKRKTTEADTEVKRVKKSK